MTMRVVVLRDLQGTMHIIPNGEIKVVSNMTRGWSRAVVDVGVGYEEDLDRALSVVRDEAAQFSTDPEWTPMLDGPVEVPGVESLGDSAMVIRSLIKTQPGSQWNAAREYRRRLKIASRPGEHRDPLPAAESPRAGGRQSPRQPSEGRRGGRRMSLRLHNTLTRRIEPFAPLVPGRVTLYTCGPTIYNYAHIGNFRTFLFEDLLRRWLEASGYEVFHIMNLTDVDDRTIDAARQEGGHRSASTWIRSPRVRGGPGLAPHPAGRTPSRGPPSTSPPMIELIAGLLEQGVAYRGEDGSVYFAIARFPAYGRLSQLDRRELRSRGERAGQRRRVRQGGRARLRALEGGQAGGRGGRRGLGRAVRPGAARAGTSSARPWRSSSSGGSGTRTCWTSTPAGWI